jgi:hypothetical protein
MKRLILTAFIVFSLFATKAIADEGMWLPMFIEKYNIGDMQSKGFKLSAEDLYSINQPSIKDAIVIFGRGCTGELISSEGLLITNHHCGYGAIQRHSSVENDYLTDGFWAMKRKEELPNAGLTVRFLVRMDDVTNQVLKGVTSQMSEAERDALVQSNSKAISDDVVKGTHFTARVASMFYGNQYIVFVYEEFLDVRLVGAPPSSIGKFGGDTDNWMWPRHTGDFALFRIYADKNNKPAAYSPENVPYVPKKFLPISLNGVEPGDFTMVYGYPGTTEQYITSHAVNQVANVSNPIKISLRDARLKIMETYMRQNDTVRIQYASKQAGVANAWKKWIGERNGLIRLDAVSKKMEIEKEFLEWAQSTPERKAEYAHLISEFEKYYDLRKPLLIASDYGREAFKAVELIRFAGQFNTLVTSALVDSTFDKRQSQRLIGSARGFFKDYYSAIDKDIFVTSMDAFTNALPDELHPALLKELYAQSGQNWSTIGNYLFNTTIFADSTKLIALLNDFDYSKALQLWNDNVYKLNYQFDTIFYSNIDMPFYNINSELNILYRTYLKGLMEMKKDQNFYPDANSTLRISYGNVMGYSPSDGVEYLYYTTLDGIAEKSKMDVYDYEVPKKLLDLHKKKDYGKWSVNGTVPVAFIATNHTSGGNSGSPVINANGHLIGVNFDRVWEGTMSDIMFDPMMCRNISLDIRYALFIIDKYAGASHLLKEMVLIK